MKTLANNPVVLPPTTKRKLLFSRPRWEDTYSRYSVKPLPVYIDHNSLIYDTDFSAVFTLTTEVTALSSPPRSSTK